MTVELRREGAVAILTLNRPEKLNALVPEMREALAAHCDAIARDSEVRAVLLTGAGRAFCAGGDISSMGAFTAVTARDRLKQAHRMVRTLADLEKPVVAAVRGPAAGIGWSLALACDMIIASDTARFVQSFRHIGLVPDGGSIYFLTQYLGVLRAKDIVYTGRPVEAAEALALGLVNRVVPDDELEAQATALATELSNGPTFALGIAKKMFKQMYEPTLETALDTEAWAQSLALLTEDHAEGASAFKAKRKPQFGGG